MTRWLAALLTGAIVSMLASVAGAACSLRVGWEPYAPYTFAGADGEPTGADIALIKAIARDIDCTTTFVELPWARIVNEVRLGTLDVSTSTSLTEERTRWAYFSKPYRVTEMALYVRRGDSGKYRLKGLADIPARRFRLGVILGYFYGDAFAELLDDPGFVKWVDAATDYPTNIRKLISGRIDGYMVEDVNVMKAELAKLGVADRVERHPLALPSEDLRFMFSQKSVPAETVAAVDETIRRMRLDGRLDTIVGQFLSN